MEGKVIDADAKHNPFHPGILKHDAYEIDSSLTRDDLYLGSNKFLNGTLYQQSE